MSSWIRFQMCPSFLKTQCERKKWNATEALWLDKDGGEALDQKFEHGMVVGRRAEYFRNCWSSKKFTKFGQY